MHESRYAAPGGGFGRHHEAMAIPTNPTGRNIRIMWGVM